MCPYSFHHWKKINPKLELVLEYTVLTVAIGGGREMKYLPLKTDMVFLDVHG